MRGEKKLPVIIVTIAFAGLLAGTAFMTGQKTGYNTGSAREKEASMEKYGFYLEPVNEQAGINFRHQCPVLDPKLKHIEAQIASMGASVSVVDFDNDGWNDIYFTNSRTGTINALYHNLHNGKFEDVAVQKGVGDVNKEGTGVSMGAVWGDYNNDGFADLLLYKWGKPELFENEGGKKFLNVTDSSGLPAWVNANSAIWFDFDNDGLLDIFIGSYFNEKLDLAHLNTTKMMPESFRYANNGGRKYLLKNMGGGKFKDVTAEYGLTSTKWVLAAAAADFTGDGYPELYIADDYNVDEFYINDGGKRFIEKGRQAGIGNIPKSGMNASFGDINNDGNVGIYTTDITEKGVLIQGNNYWQPKGGLSKDPVFVNLGQLAGIENAGWSYGAQFGDLNNDGYMDLYAANGFVSGKKNTSYWYDYSKVTGGNSSIIGDAANWPDMQGKSQSGYQQDKIWLNDSTGSFEDVSGKVCPEATYDGRAIVMADLWNRGVLDVIVANQNNIPLVYKNEEPANSGNHWIDFDLHGTTSNASAIGARVEVLWHGRQQTQIVTGGMGFSSQNQHRLHFGIGKSNAIDKVVILWPSGKIDEITSPQIDKLHVITESKAEN
ncbi:MAG TPA: CRTAC1 family protein [Chitinophagaceae bacterium]|nr:CRTAC1 family protein [Chitinophagaceae bacterium]